MANRPPEARRRHSQLSRSLAENGTRRCDWQLAAKAARFVHTKRVTLIRLGRAGDGRAPTTRRDSDYISKKHAIAVFAPLACGNNNLFSRQWKDVVSCRLPRFSGRLFLPTGFRKGVRACERRRAQTPTVAPKAAFVALFFVFVVVVGGGVALLRARAKRC